jgi:hypothetical protein
MAVVLHLDRDVAVVVDEGAKADFVFGAAFGQRLRCIEEQVHDDLLEPSGVRVDEGHASVIGHEPRVVAELVRDEVLGGAQRLDDIGRARRFTGVGAREHAQLADDRGDPSDALLEILDTRRDVRSLVCADHAPQVGAEGLQAEREDRQRIVDFVRDAGSKGAERREAIALRELCFQANAIRDVARESEDRRLPAVLAGDRRDLRNDSRAVATLRLVRAWRETCAGAHGRDAFHHRARVARRHQRVQRDPEKLRAGGVAQHTSGGRVRVEDDAVSRDDDPVGRGVEEPTQSPLFGAQQIFRLATNAHIGEDRNVRRAERRRDVDHRDGYGNLSARGLDDEELAERFP